MVGLYFRHLYLLEGDPRGKAVKAGGYTVPDTVSNEIVNLFKLVLRLAMVSKRTYLECSVDHGYLVLTGNNLSRLSQAACPTLDLPTQKTDHELNFRLPSRTR